MSLLLILNLLAFLDCFISTIASLALVSSKQVGESSRILSSLIHNESKLLHVESPLVLLLLVANRIIRWSLLKSQAMWSVSMVSVIKFLWISKSLRIRIQERESLLEEMTVWDIVESFINTTKLVLHIASLNYFIYSLESSKILK